MVPFSVQNLPFTDPMLTVWAQLVNLAGSKLEKQCMKKSLSRGLTGTPHAEITNQMQFWWSDEERNKLFMQPSMQKQTNLCMIINILVYAFVIEADQVDVHLLRCQQLRLYILKAARALLSHQDELRQILSQPAVIDVSPNPTGETRMSPLITLLVSSRMHFLIHLFALAFVFVQLSFNAVVS